MYALLRKIGIFILSIAVLVGYKAFTNKEVKQKLGVEIKITDMNKIIELFKDLKFLMFHSAVKNIEYKEQLNIYNTTVNVYEITEEEKVLGGYYDFKSKNKIYVKTINPTNLLTNIRMRILYFFSFDFNTEFIAYFNEDKNAIILEERRSISGSSLLADIVSFTAHGFHTKMLIEIKRELENQNKLKLPELE
jgi:hypothetical protein